MLRKYSIFTILAIPIFYVCLCGFTVSLEKEPLSYYLDHLSKTEPIKIELKAYYKVVFQAAVNVLQDLNINIIEKDYEKKLILGAYYNSGCFAAYSVVFLQNADSLMLEVKGRGAWFSSNYIAEKIKKEVKLLEIMSENQMRKVE